MEHADTVSTANKGTRTEVFMKILLGAFQLISVGLVAWVTFVGITPRRRATSV